MGKKKDTPEWRLFEQQVARFLRAMDENAQVLWNQKVVGRLSGTPRQIDALITGTFAGEAVTFIAECKRYGSPLGIDLVDELVGKTLDVGADRGLLYSFKGYTAPARSRAKGAVNPKISVYRLPEDSAVDYESVIIESIKFGDCPNPNCSLGDVDWTRWRDEESESEVIGGYCNTCGTGAVRCLECCSVLVVDRGDWPCDGCEAVYTQLVDRDAVPDGFARVR